MNATPTTLPETRTSKLTQCEPTPTFVKVQIGVFGTAVVFGLLCQFTWDGIVSLIQARAAGPEPVLLNQILYVKRVFCLACATLAVFSRVKPGARTAAVRESTSTTPFPSIPTTSTAYVPFVRGGASVVPKTFHRDG